MSEGSQTCHWIYKMSFWKGRNDRQTENVIYQITCYRTFSWVTTKWEWTSLFSLSGIFSMVPWRHSASVCHQLKVKTAFFISLQRSSQPRAREPMSSCFLSSISLFGYLPQCHLPRRCIMEYCFYTYRRFVTGGCSDVLKDGWEEKWNAKNSSRQKPSPFIHPNKTTSLGWSAQN